MSMCTLRLYQPSIRTAALTGPFIHGGPLTVTKSDLYDKSTLDIDPVVDGDITPVNSSGAFGPGDITAAPATTPKDGA